MTRVMRFKPTGPIWGLQCEAVLPYGDGFILIVIHSGTLYKVLIELRLRVAASFDGFLQILQTAIRK